VHAARRFVSKDVVRKPLFPVTLTKSENCALLRKSAAVESTALAQPFCVNQAVGDMPQHLHAQFVIVRQFPTGIGPTKLYNNERNVNSKQIRQLLIVYNHWTLRHAMMKKMTSFPKRCIFIFWVNRPTQNLTG